MQSSLINLEREGRFFDVNDWVVEKSTGRHFEIISEAWCEGEFMLVCLQSGDPDGDWILLSPDHCSKLPTLGSD